MVGRFMLQRFLREKERSGKDPRTNTRRIVQVQGKVEWHFSFRLFSCPLPAVGFFVKVVLIGRKCCCWVKSDVCVMIA